MALHDLYLINNDPQVYDDFKNENALWFAQQKDKRFLSPLEKKKFAEVQGIPASHTKRNLLGYKALVKFNPDSDLYAAKIQTYQNKWEVESALLGCSAGDKYQTTSHYFKCDDDHPLDCEKVEQKNNVTISIDPRKYAEYCGPSSGGILKGRGLCSKIEPCIVEAYLKYEKSGSKSPSFGQLAGFVTKNYNGAADF